MTRALSFAPLLLLPALVVMASGCGAAPPRAEGAHAATAQPPSTGALFDVGGHRLYLECGGTGAVTVVLGHGQGSSHATWDKIWPDLVGMGRVCRYDRASRGNSELGPVPTTSGRIVQELHALLKAAGVPPPYVMVGHSFGGMNAQLYAHTFPSEVVGMVLIESSSRDYDPRTPSAGAMPDDPEERRLFSDFLRGYDATMRNYALSPEGVDWEASYHELSAVTDFGDLPLYVVTAGDRAWTAPPYFPPSLKARLARTWLDAQTRLAARSRCSTHVVAEGAGHFVQQDRADVVEKAIKAVLAGAASCKGRVPAALGYAPPP